MHIRHLDRILHKMYGLQDDWKSVWVARTLLYSSYSTSGFHLLKVTSEQSFTELQEACDMISVINYHTASSISSSGTGASQLLLAVELRAIWSLCTCAQCAAFLAQHHSPPLQRCWVLMAVAGFCGRSLQAGHQKHWGCLRKVRQL